MEAKSTNDIKKENLDEAKEDIIKQLEVMKKATDDKMEQAIEHFMNQCEVASKKYLSVNGLLQAKASLVSALGGTYADLRNTMSEEEICKQAAYIADQASSTILDISDKFFSICEAGDYKDLLDMLDGYMDADFVNNEDRYSSAYETARELTMCSILANLQPNIDDLYEFHTHAQGEMNKLHDELIVKA